MLSLATVAAKYFKLESIRHSSLLEHLTLTGEPILGPRHCNVVDMLELDLIAWTWTMPHLSTIELTGQSAFSFRLEWIRQCPSLKTLIVDVLTPAALEPNMEDIAKGPCGERLRLCHLNIFEHEKLSEEWFPKLLETYCGHVIQLKLTTPFCSTAELARVDLELALTAAKALSSLETLTIALGLRPDLSGLMERFGLVHGEYCHRTR